MLARNTTVAVMAVAVSLASNLGLLHAAAPSATATEINPVPGRRLELLVPETILPLTYRAMARDGSRIVITSDEDPNSHVQSRYDVWTNVADRYLPAAVGIVSGVGATPDATTLVVSSPYHVTDDDTDVTSDLYLVTPTTRTLVTPDTDSSAFLAHVADDGSAVVFRTREALDPADTNTDQDLYRWQRDVPGFTYLTEGRADPTFAIATDDGSHVIFKDALNDTYYERVGAAAIPRATGGGVKAFSADGSRLYFTATGPMNPSDTDGQNDVYWSESDGTMHLATGWSDAPITFVRVSPDESRMLVTSSAQLTADDTDASTDVYIMEGEQMELVSLGSVAADRAWADEGLNQVVYRTWSMIDPTDTTDGNDLYRWDSSHPGEAELLTKGVGSSNQSTVDLVSTDGSRIIFETPEAVLPDDVATGWPDLYEWHDGVITNLTPATDGQVEFVAGSADGTRIIFESQLSLVTEDLKQGGIYVSDADLTPPVAMVSGPASGAAGPEADITFGTQDDDAVWFDCQLDQGSWAPCTSPYHLAGLVGGAHTILVKAWDAAGNPSEPASATWTVTPAPTPTPSPTPTPTPTPAPLDTTPPIGSISIAGGATNTKATTVTVSTPATDTGSGVSQVGLSNDGSTWQYRPYAATQHWNITATNGARTVFAKWKDVAGNWSAVKTDTIVLDTVGPSVTAPSRGFVPGTSISGGLITLRVPWTGTDATSGIARYELYQQTDSGAWTKVSSTLTSPTISKALLTEHAYAFRVRAVDRAGNIGPWATGPTVRLSRYSETNPKITYAGSWTTVQSSVFWGGQAKKASTAGAKASITFTGRSIAWVARNGPERGKAEIYVGGTKVATVDLYAATYQNQRVVWVGSFSNSGPWAVSVKVLGTTGRPRVDMDAFVTVN